jgi:hypothetical protein
MLRRIGILTFGPLCLIGAISMGCGSDHHGSNNQESAGAAGTQDGDPDQQTANTAGTSGGGGFPGQGPGAGGGSGANPGAGGQGGPGANNSAHVQFVLKEVH